MFDEIRNQVESLNIGSLEWGGNGFRSTFPLPVILLSTSKTVWKWYKLIIFSPLRKLFGTM